MSRGLHWTPAALAALLLACSQTTAPPPGAADASITAPAPVASVVAPAPATSSAPAAANAPAYDARVIHFGGYGPAAFLGDEESVRQSFGRPMVGAPDPKDPGACYYLRAETPQTKGYGVRFMFEGGKFVRYDVDDASIVAPGGISVGMDAAAALAVFPGRVESQPHKYIEGGKVLIVTPETGGTARLIFEADASGTITGWRIGLEPQVHYVEGCS